MRTTLVLLGSAVVVVIALGTLAGPRAQQPAHPAVGETKAVETPYLTPRQLLGKKLFNDTNLSNPPGQSCATCHAASSGFEAPEHEEPVAPGEVKGRFGNRNAPTAAYAAFSPYFHYSEADGYVGGQFWDGRAPDLAAQAEGPFLNPLEMNNPDKASVVAKISQADYADLFSAVYGPDPLDEVEQAYANAARAIHSYEETNELNEFSSKYDWYLAGRAQLSDDERQGLALFEDPKKGNCAACHPSRPQEEGAPPLFTDHTYDNIGVPKNPENPFYAMPKEFNPDGPGYVDLGLGGVLKKPSEYGKFKVPTLRNVAVTAPYMHNGVFETLHEVISFYNSRDVNPWPAPEVPDTVNKEELGNLGLTEEEIEDIVGFLGALTDGYDPASEAAGRANE
jgi:cytochrome c peroxidase